MKGGSHPDWAKKKNWARKRFKRSEAGWGTKRKLGEGILFSGWRSNTVAAATRSSNGERWPGRSRMNWLEPDGFPGRKSPISLCSSTDAPRPARKQRKSAGIQEPAWSFIPGAFPISKRPVGLNRMRENPNFPSLPRKRESRRCPRGSGEPVKKIWVPVFTRNPVFLLSQE